MTINQEGRDIIVPKMTNVTKKPLLVMSAGPIMGHTAPTLHIAREMINRGFEVIFMTAPDLRENVEKIGAEYYETSPFWPEGTLEEREKYPAGMPRMMYDMEWIFMASIPSRVASLRSLLEMVRERDPSRDVVIVAETVTMGVLPFKYGAPLPKGYTEFPKVISINVVPLVVSSIDVGPFGPGLPPDSTKSGRARNQLLYQLMHGNGPFATLNNIFHETLRKVACTSVPTDFMFDAWVTSFDTLFQLCSPSLEYPRSDLHPSIRYAGALPKRGIDPKFSYPSWWPELQANAKLPTESPDRKKIIPIAQGTVATNYNELIIPAIKAFAKRSDVLLIVILGVKGATLPSDLDIPSNVRVVDYLPYDAALEYGDVFVSNGGYGGMMHGVINGIPMIVAGMSEDKVEVSARAEYAGFAVNLKTQTPSSEQIYEAAEKIFNDTSYKRAAVRLMGENEDLDSLSIIEKQIMRYARKNSTEICAYAA
ncbi:hypothetical protein JX265_008710 [Neoarthrinium moseri]|uniref:Erythromycin biosynthesis protein CIII-like C-terminal domain-containing protein n=1 Tax=Neoarthrinium moseri TaxID=1658444 RepID=A0A9P9WHD0_9PEZI|nr:uncharacterized protein JN550_008813 [Neoarthrinium moseri]KAI1848509.1 hypothetical protein JX266_005815 [Neoarthrinium moseri]KAI1863493.1 hypothetical protein JX265_008710 [Neoarthrinium moseri]KAI1864526.1 hypothetical protein JN550_008813 [Neoarthrinium moseri]